MVAQGFLLRRPETTKKQCEFDLVVGKLSFITCFNLISCSLLLLWQLATNFDAYNMYHILMCACVCEKMAWKERTLCHARNLSL